MQGWENMDREALDDAYANAEYIPGAADFPPRWAVDAAAFRAATPGETGLLYDATDGAALDLFYSAGSAPKGLIVFIHGGYWRRFGKSDWSHFARGGLLAGHAVAMVGYPLAPARRISEITALVSRAVDLAAAKVEGPVRLTGHSAGGHLAARMLMADAAPVCASRIATCVPISPVADLRPLVPQSLNDDLRLTPEEARAESPALGTPSVGARVSVHVGAEERPSFLWQAEALAKAWSTPCHQTPGRHHFDVIDHLLDPASRLMKDILA